MAIIMNHNCCCLLSGQVCSATLQTPAKGNRVAVIAESPTEAAVDLGMPLVGKTGVNVCRLFELLKERDPERYKQFCLRRALVLNASLKKVNGKLEPNGEYEFNQMKDYLWNRDRIVPPWGSWIGWIVKMHPKDEGAKKPVAVPERTKMELIAEWVDNCCRGKGSYSIGQFEAYYSKRIEEVIKMPCSCRR